MQKSMMAETRKRLLFSLLGLGLVAALVILPYQFRSQAGSQAKKTNDSFRTESHVEGLENYDIREDKTKADVLIGFRQAAGQTAVAVADIREQFVQGEAALKERIPDLTVDYNLEIHTPEVIGPDVWKSTASFLTPPSDAKHSEILRGFVKENDSLVGVSDAQADALKVTADYTNPDGNLSFAHLEQRINDVPVFRGEVKAGFTKRGEMVRVISNLATGLDYQSLSNEFGNPADAVRAAAGYINYELKSSDTARNAAESTNLKSVFGTGDRATTAEKMYFPTEPGVAVPSWRVLIWQPTNAYYVIVDAETGAMLWRKNIAEDQTQSATYNVYANPTAMIDVADSPAPLTPGPISPTLGTQGTLLTRVDKTLIGNEAPYTFNNNGWITDGQNVTDGNAVEAGVDRVAPNGVDTPLQAGNPNRVFTTSGPAWNPPPGNPAPGDAPLDPQAQRGAVIQMFYVMNRYHDEMYRLGFTEQAFNFQQDNFGRGGVGNDRISAEGQDSSGTNNANFFTPADGGRGIMQMYIWTGPTPDYDGTADADVIIHEATHGTSNRLHGNAAGLSNNMSRGMGEGWSDWYGHAMLSEPTDPINGIYTTGGYATYLSTAGFTANYYYGIRRFPKAVIAFLGPNGKPHNPLSFRHLNSNCNIEIGTPTAIGTISAFPRGPFGVSQCDAVHNAGEIWSSALWEVRALMINRLGWAVGNRKVLQLVTDGMKLAPPGPTFITERNAIIAAAAASSVSPEASADVADVREGFRRRGMGFSASITTISPAVVTEAFDQPNVSIVDPFSVSDSTGDNDGFPEPGESLLLSVAVTNTTGTTVNNVVATVTGGGSANYGNIADGQTVTRQIPYTVPASAECGSLHTVSITVSSDVGTQTPVTRTFRLGAPVGGAPTTFSNAAAITIADNSPSTPYPSTINVSGLTGNKVVRVELTGLSHTYPDDIDVLLRGPNGQSLVIMSDVGGSGDVSGINVQLVDTATAGIPDSGQITAGEYKPSNVDTTTDVFPAPAPAAPYNNPAPAGTATFASAFGTAGSGLNGAWELYVRDDVGTDSGSIAGGWKITFESNDYVCDLDAGGGPVADFDGDGRTDLSVFRPDNGTWYLQRSTAGFSAVTFGTSTDVLAPGDYDGDGKADQAVFRDGTWYALLSQTSTTVFIPFGQAGDVPVPGDYDGDGTDDQAVFRAGTWYARLSTGGTAFIPFGQAGDVPVVGDFDGDGKDDQSVFRAGQWITLKSSGGVQYVSFGLASDTLVPADYDGDGKTDQAVFRDGTWYANLSGSGTAFIPFGQAGDIPAPGDYDGDGTDDQAVFRAGTWYVRKSTGGVQVTAFGQAADKPVPTEYLP